mgnify:CR=1 FL=1
MCVESVVEHGSESLVRQQVEFAVIQGQKGLQADQVQPGAYVQLDAKALKLTGGADSPKPPAGRGTYAWVMDQRQADVFLTYCTNAVAAQAEVPRLRVVQLPAALQVGAAYGLTVRADAPAAALAFASALRQPPAQAVLQRLGFGLP